MSILNKALDAASEIKNRQSTKTAYWLGVIDGILMSAIISTAVLMVLL
jgi:hypothetical protein